jgi:hypothetical protein
VCGCVGCGCGWGGGGGGGGVVLPCTRSEVLTAMCFPLWRAFGQQFCMANLFVNFNQ